MVSAKPPQPPRAVQVNPTDEHLFLVEKRHLVMLREKPDHKLHFRLNGGQQRMTRVRVRVHSQPHLCSGSWWETRAVPGGLRLHHSGGHQCPHLLTEAAIQLERLQECSIKLTGVNCLAPGVTHRKSLGNRSSFTPTLSVQLHLGSLHSYKSRRQSAIQRVSDQRPEPELVKSPRCCPRVRILRDLLQPLLHPSSTPSLWPEP